MSANICRDCDMKNISNSEVRTAWFLLLPAIIIFILIAFYPLVSVFYYSLTDKKFASAKPTEFIGFENYRMMLSMKFFEIPAQKDDAGNVMHDEKGEIVYSDSMDVLPMEPVAYWEMYTFDFFGKRYSLGATDPEFVKSIKDTVLFSVFAVALELMLGMAFAVTLNSHFKGRGGDADGAADSLGYTDGGKHEDVGLDVQFTGVWSLQYAGVLSGNSGSADCIFGKSRLAVVYYDCY